MSPVTIVLLVIALVCFIAATLGVTTRRIDLTAAGLAFWVAAVLVGGLGLK